MNGKRPTPNAFVVATVWPETPLAKAIMLVLIIEAIGILGMEVFVFPDSTRPIIDATTMMRVIGPTTILP